jgi:uncharacterized protein YprB with RNaseH-like and TPR domain
MKLKQLRCIHRHSIDTHPACFAQGRIDYDFQSDREWERATGQPWWTFPDYKIGYFDLEADGLKTDFATMLTWSVKGKGEKPVTGVIKKKELFTTIDVDKRLMTDLCKELSKYKIIVTYFGTRYDLPFARTKAMRYRLPFLEYGETYHWDLFYTVKSKTNLSRKSLDNICDYLGIEGKTPIDRETWRRAKYGNKEALKEVVEHNEGDVEITEALHERLMPFRKWIRTSV